MLQILFGYKDSINQLPKYQTHPVCIKCGHNELFAGEAALTIFIPVRNTIGKMRRVCRCCGYTWHEKPISSVSESL